MSNYFDHLFTFLALRESSNLLTDWQYFGVFGYIMHVVCTEGGGTEERKRLFRGAIEGNENQLPEMIDVESGSLWRELLARGVLTEEQIQLCRSEVSIIFVLCGNFSCYQCLFSNYGYLPTLRPSHLRLACSLPRGCSLQ